MSEVPLYRAVGQVRQGLATGVRRQAHRGTSLIRTSPPVGWDSTHDPDRAAPTLPPACSISIYLSIFLFVHLAIYIPRAERYTGGMRYASGAKSAIFFTIKNSLSEESTGPNPLDHGDDFSRPALRHGSLNSLFQVASYLPS